MGLFGRKKAGVPVIDTAISEPVLRCSICNGEQVMCSRDRRTGEMTELMLIRSSSDLDDFCRANGIRADEIENIY